MTIASHSLLKTSTRKRGPLTKEERKKMIEKDHKMVKGVFRCFEPRGGSFTFSFKKWKGDDVLHYTMEDGETYEVPFMVAQHLNKNCWYPVHENTVDMNGAPLVQVGKKVQRCNFESLEFMIDE